MGNKLTGSIPSLCRAAWKSQCSMNFMPWFSSSPSIISLSVARSLLPHISFSSPPHPPGPAPGMDLDNCGLSCVCLINSSAGFIFRMQLYSWVRMEIARRQAESAESRLGWGPRDLPALLVSSTLGTGWSAPCPAVATLRGGGGKGDTRTHKDRWRLTSLTLIFTNEDTRNWGPELLGDLSRDTQLVKGRLESLTWAWTPKPIPSTGPPSLIT